MSGRFSIAARLKSFTFAFAGIATMLRTQHNAWLHLVATIAVLAAGFALNVSADDWRWLVTAIVLVWTAETVNTAFEHLCDVVSPEFQASVQKSKDIAAGAVLICAIGALIIGLQVFRPIPLAALSDEEEAKRDQTMRLTRDASGERRPR